MTNVPFVILLGILSTIQTHLAKALERQGIEVFEQLKARLQQSGQSAPLDLRKPAIYTAGVVLNNTLFIWSTLAQPYGPPALFSSMFGVGLIFLLIYARLVLKETISRREWTGALAILCGTLFIGLENIHHAAMDRFTMRLPQFLVVLGVWVAFSTLFAVWSTRRSNLAWCALALGILAGSLGSLDPFLKGVGQNYGGQPGILPSNWVGSAIFAASFVIGFIAFLVTQIGFAKKVRASLLVPVYNAAFMGLPVLWQIILLPAYQLTFQTVLGMVLIITGAVSMHPRARHPSTTQKP